MKIKLFHHKYAQNYTILDFKMFLHIQCPFSFLFQVNQLL